MSNLDLLIEELEETFEKHRDEEFSRSMHDYTGRQFVFYGIKTQPRRKLTKNFFNGCKELSHYELFDLAEKLYRKNEREYHHTAIELLDKNLTPQDLLKQDIEFFDWLILRHSWWDTIDVIAPRLVRDYFLAFPERKDKIVDLWLESKNKWLVRSAILFQLKLKEEVDLPYLFDVIKRATGTEEFFINKAIGWILREHGKRYPDEIKEFVIENQHILHPLTIKEGTRLLKR